MTLRWGSTRASTASSARSGRHAGCACSHRAVLPACLAAVHAVAPPVTAWRVATARCATRGAASTPPALAPGREVDLLAKVLPQRCHRLYLAEHLLAESCGPHAMRAELRPNLGAAIAMLSTLLALRCYRARTPRALISASCREDPPQQRNQLLSSCWMQGHSWWCFHQGHTKLMGRRTCSPSSYSRAQGRMRVHPRVRVRERAGLQSVAVARRR